MVHDHSQCVEGRPGGEMKCSSLAGQLRRRADAVDFKTPTPPTSQCLSTATQQPMQCLACRARARCSQAKAPAHAGLSVSLPESQKSPSHTYRLIARAAAERISTAGGKPPQAAGPCMAMHETRLPLWATRPARALLSKTTLQPVD